MKHRVSNNLLILFFLLFTLPVPALACGSPIDHPYLYGLLILLTLLFIRTGYMSFEFFKARVTSSKILSYVKHTSLTIFIGSILYLLSTLSLGTFCLRSTEEVLIGEITGMTLLITIIMSFLLFIFTVIANIIIKSEKQGLIVFILLCLLILQMIVITGLLRITVFLA